MNRPTIGSDLHLTIDPELQTLAQETLGERKGAMVLLDAQTGAILAMASWPHIDPQQLSFNPYAEDWGAENKRIIDYYTTVSTTQTILCSCAPRRVSTHPARPSRRYQRAPP